MLNRSSELLTRAIPSGYIMPTPINNCIIENSGRYTVFLLLRCLGLKLVTVEASEAVRIENTVIQQGREALGRSLTRVGA